MDVFALRKQVLDDYHRYVKSFLNIRDRRIREYVDGELSRGVLWPDTLVQLNPSYEMGKTVSDLVAEGVIHPLCGKIFLRKGKSIHLYKHQEQAVRIAAKKEPYVLTTGTGSGKSLTYLIPIMDHVLKNNPGPEQVRAIIVYPMNALINSQEKEIGRLLENLGAGNSPIRFGRYTGQEGAEERNRLQQHPPHILLTNYVMLELMMSRPFERVFLDRTLANLEFLVLDELHTYTGRQGADVGMLVRRVRRRCGNENLLCVGTSATMVSGGTRDDQKRAVAQVSGKIFGVDVSPDNVIDESLRQSIRCQGATTPEILKEEIKKGIPGSYEDFVSNPLAAWIEETFGIQKEGDFYRRRVPITLQQGAGRLAELTGTDTAQCEEIIRRMLRKGSELRHSEDEPVFAVRLHQFISQGDTVYATLEPNDKRHITLSAQRFAPPANGEDRLMAPLVFCRICGQEYYLVTLNRADGKIEPRLPDEMEFSEEELITEGYLLIDDEENPVWGEDRNEDLPENWFRPTKKGRSLKSEYREFVPQQVYVSADGVISDSPRVDAAGGWFIAAPFLTCLCCGEVYDKRTRRDFPKLARLSSEGRSTATTLLSISTVTRMQQDEDIAPEARKILSFTDNRQDASLQAGHFNDFIQVGLLRSAIYLALPEHGALDHSQVPSEVVKALNLSQSVYAQNPGEIGVQPKRNREAFTDFIEYRIYQDLRRGWRIVQPNLEQCGLLKIGYDGLEDVCRQNDLWDNNPVLQAASPENRFKVVRAFLDHLRRSLALDARCLEGVYHDTLRRKVNQTLKEPWCFDDDEMLVEEKWFAWGEKHPGDRSLSPISLLAKYLRHSRTWQGLPARLSVAEYEELLRALVDILTRAGYLEQEVEGDDFRIQLRVDTLQWVKGDGTIVEPDPVRSVHMRSAGDEFLSREANRFFAGFYQAEAMCLKELEGREHTGQTSRQDREDRENRFRKGELSCLYCSPTMELGIDIADLNTVNMRNVPPTPANYAQRSGRAGRSGQPAFISTYCSTGSGHDQYFFHRQPEMVAGVVSPPRLELTNEELVESHVHAVWLGEVGLFLGNSIADVVDLSQDDYPLLDNVARQIELSENKIRNCLDNCRAILGQFSKDLEAAGWYSEEWLENVIRASVRRFNEAFDRLAGAV
ncbi:MAG TPA: DEAD/DEAH box helicase [archaeon]|nr:DEAD/DEAH box helicase [archaeon]